MPPGSTAIDDLLEKPAGVKLARLSAVHPDPRSVRPALEALRAGIDVARGPAPALVAALDTPNGPVELR